MRMLPLFFVLCSIAPAIAQSNSEIVYWPSATIKGYSPKLKSRQTDKNLTASEYLSDLGNYKFDPAQRWQWRRRGSSELDGYLRGSRR